MNQRVVLFGVFLLVGYPRSAVAQDPDPSGDWRIAGAASAFYHGRSEIDRWQPGFSAGVRRYFLNVFHLELSLNRDRSQQEEGVICAAFSSCGQPKTVNGSFSIFSLGVGINARGRAWKPYGGIAYGRASEVTDWSAEGYDGPTWTGYMGLEREVSSAFSAFLEYRVHRQYWDNDYQSILKDIHIIHHQIDLGLAYNPWLGPPEMR